MSAFCKWCWNTWRKTVLFCFLTHSLLGAYYHPWLRQELKQGLRAWFRIQKDPASQLGSAPCWGWSTDLSTHPMERLSQPVRSMLHMYGFVRTRPSPFQVFIIITASFSLFCILFGFGNSGVLKSFLPKQSIYIVLKKSNLVRPSKLGRKKKKQNKTMLRTDSSFVLFNANPLPQSLL